jgi:hypothetical protein
VIAGGRETVSRGGPRQDRRTLDFPHIVLLLGLLLLGTSALSGWLHGTELSISVLSLAEGAGGDALRYERHAALLV